MPSNSVFSVFYRFALALVLGLLLCVFLIYQWRVESEFHQLRISESFHVKLAAATLHKIIEEPISDTLILSNNQRLKQWTNKPDDRQQAQRVADYFKNFISYKPSYDQLRFLDNTGTERVRVNFQLGQPYIVPASDLQRKSTRYYFQEALNLRHSQIYVSPMDLNKEQGVIEKPLKPTIRLATPVFNHLDQRIGVLVVNYLVEPMLQRLSDLSADTKGVLMVLNDQGYWLYHPDEKLRWGFMLKHMHSLPNYYPDEWLTMVSEGQGQWMTENGLFTAQSMLPVKKNNSMQTFSSLIEIIHTNGYPWYTMTRISAEQLQAIKTEIRHNLAIVITPFTLLLLLALYFIARYRAQHAQQQTLITESEIHHRSILESIADGVMTVDISGKIIDTNPAAQAIFGMSDEQLQSHLITDLLVSDQHGIQLQEQILKPQTQSDNKPSKLLECSGLRGLTKPFPLQITHSPLQLNDRQCKTVTLRDVSEQQRARQELLLASEVFDTANDGIVLTDSDKIIQRVNPAFCRLTGYQPDELKGKKTSILRSNLTDDETYQSMWDSIDRTDRWEGEISNRVKSGEIRIFYLSIFTIRGSRGDVISYAGISRDITEEKENEDRIRTHAYYDSLTGLPNRTLFLERLQQSINRGERYNEPFSIFFIDLDRFKKVNDTLGHDAGDHLLKLVAERIGSLIRDSDTLSRLGGDEFSLMLTHTDRNNNLAMLAQKIISIMNVPFDIKGRDAHIGASIGISTFPDDGRDTETLLRKADTAMYQAKRGGRNSYSFFSKALNSAIEQKIRLEDDLRIAIHEDQFELYLQPIVNIRQNSVEGAEALIRWHHPVRGILSPGEFIPLAEETGLIQPLSEWVILNAASQLSAWRDTFLEPLSLSVNLSPYKSRHAVDNSFVKNALQKTAAPPSQLTFEIKEDLIMENTEESLKWLSFMKDLGISLAIDNFGTGFSSLSYLKRFPVDTIKIDRSFIDDIDTNPENETLVMAIIAMAKNLELEVIAEGVENSRQLDVLKHCQDHCNLIQGFLFARPMPAEKFFSYVKNFDFDSYPERRKQKQIIQSPASVPITLVDTKTD